MLLVAIKEVFIFEINLLAVYVMGKLGGCYWVRGSVVKNCAIFPKFTVYKLWLPLRQIPKNLFKDGAGMGSNSIICETYKTGLKSQGCQTLHQLGLPLGNGTEYNFECHRFGIPGARKVLLLLWCEDIQRDLF